MFRRVKNQPKKIKVNNEKQGKRPAVDMGTLHPTLIVGIGGSAGALNAYKALLDALPSNTGMAFVIISHMNPTANSQLALLLSRHTKMMVKVASMAMPILANHVYVIPPDADLLIENYTFQVISPRSGRNKQVDVFFVSLAEAMGVRAIGIVLSGYDGDGTEGCKHIQANGGKTFAQDMSAEVNFMPLSAQASNCIDFVMPLDKIPDKLRSLAAALTTQKVRNNGRISKCRYPTWRKSVMTREEFNNLADSKWTEIESLQQSDFYEFEKRFSIGCPSMTVLWVNKL